MVDEESYIKNLEWMVEHLHSDIKEAKLEVEARSEETKELGAIINKLMDKLNELAKKLEEKPKPKPKPRSNQRLDYDEFIEENLIGKSFIVKQLMDEYKLPRFKAYAIVDRIRKKYKDKFKITYDHDKRVLKINAISPSSLAPSAPLIPPVVK
jgi:hypothetical protein